MPEVVMWLSEFENGATKGDNPIEVWGKTVEMHFLPEKDDLVFMFNDSHVMDVWGANTVKRRFWGPKGSVELELVGLQHINELTPDGEKVIRSRIAIDNVNRRGWDDLTNDPLNRLLRMHGWEPLREFRERMRKLRING